MDIISRSSDIAFELFGKAHLWTVLIMLLVNIGMIYLSKRYKVISDFYKKYLILSLILLDLLYRLWGLLGPNNYVITLTVHISSASVILAVIMLLKFNQKIFDVLFYWGLIIVPQAIITPGTPFGFPHLRFFQILLIHFNVLFSVVYLLSVEKRKITRYSFKRAVIVTHLYVVFIFIVNTVFSTNYMFISQKPSVSSLIDYLGPWPYYLIAMDVIMILLFAIAYRIYLRSTYEHN